MSQIDSGISDLGPDNQLPHGIFPDIARANRGGALARQGIVDRLNAPGLAALPAVDTSGTIRLAEGLKQALGLTAQVTNQLGAANIAQINQEERNRADALSAARTAQHDIEVRQAKSDILERGLATKNSAVDLQEWDDLAKNGHLRLDPGQDASDIADQIIKNKTDGLSTPYKSQYENVKPHLIALLNRTRDAENAKNQHDINQVLFYGAQGANDQASVDATREGFQQFNPEASPLDYQTKIALPAAQAAAKLGTAGKDRLALWMPEIADLPDQQGAVQATFLGKVAQDDEQNLKAIHGTVASMEINGQSPEAISQYVQKGVDSGTIPPVQGLQLIHSQTERAKRIDIENRARISDSYESNIRAQATSAAVSALQGGQSYLIQGVKTKRPDGGEISISDDQLREQARDTMFATIDQQYPSAAPATHSANTAAKIRVLAPTNLTNPAWSSALQDPASLILASPPDEAVSARIENGYNTYRELNAMSPNGAMTARHTNEKDNTFWRWVDATIATDPTMTPTMAARQVSDALRKDPSTIKASSLKSNQDIIKAGDAFAAGADNAPDIANEFSRRAHVYSTIFGMPVTSAVNKAKAEMTADYQKMDGLMVKTRGLGFINPGNADTLSSTITGAFKAEYPQEKDQPLKLSLGSDGAWGVASTTRPGVPVNDKWLLSDNDMGVISGFIAQREAESSRKSTIDAKFEKDMTAYENSGKVLGWGDSSALASAANWWDKTFAKSAPSFGPRPYAPMPTPFNDFGRATIPENAPPVVKSILEHYDLMKKLQSQTVPSKSNEFDPSAPSM